MTNIDAGSATGDSVGSATGIGVGSATGVGVGSASGVGSARSVNAGLATGISAGSMTGVNAGSDSGTYSGTDTDLGVNLNLLIKSRVLICVSFCSSSGSSIGMWWVAGTGTQRGATRHGHWRAV